jgi:hypothetical protein
MSVRTTIAALALAGFGLAGSAAAAASGALAAAAPSAAVLTTFGNPHVTGIPSAVTLADTTDGGSLSQGIPIPH